MKRSYPLIVALTAGLLGSAALAQNRNTLLHELFADYDEWRLRESPESAMAQGDYSNADKISDSSLAAIERRHNERKAFLERLQKFDRASLSVDDQLNYDLFNRMLSDRIAGHAYMNHLMPIGSRSGPHQRIPQMSNRVRFQSELDFNNYCKRLEATPQLINDTIAALQQGLDKGITPPKIVLKGVPDQLRRLTETGGLDALATPFADVDEKLESATAAVLSRRFEAKSEPEVRRALLKLLGFFEREYLPKCRDGIAAADLPNGKDYYAHQLRVMTTTDLTAKEIHEIGLKEVARIRKEMLEVIRRSDYFDHHPESRELDEDKLLAAFINYLRTDARFYYETEEELLAGYRDICKQIDAWMPRLFGHLPRLPYGVIKIPDFMAPSQTTAYYSHGDIRNAEPGYFYANTYALNQRPKYEMRALAVHEAVPGHHHQVAIAQELEGLPEFRKNYWITAFGEGWALYSERLGIEMGLYEDPYDDFGRLTYEMWRACRLVVDPGMHALGWTRQQAVDFMLANTALSEVNINAEVDRYISWPGQATAYKLGELKIRELRSKAEETLGDRFDLRAFHDKVLEAGSIPLDVLEKRVNAWIESQNAPETAARD